MSTFGAIRRSLLAMATLAAVGRTGPRLPMPLPPVTQHKRGAWRHRTVDMYYLSSAWKRVAKSKQYPHSSHQQNERFCRNYSTDDNGNIMAIGRKHHKEIERILKEKAA